MKNVLVVALALVVIAGLVWLVWFRDDPHSEGILEPPLFESSGTRPEPPTGSLDSLEAPEPPAAPERAKEPAERTRASTEAMPDPYRKALSGVIGRVVESDGAPVPDKEVTLLEIRAAPLLSSQLELFDDGSKPLHLELASAVTDEEGRFQLDGAHSRGFHALGIDLGGPRGTLRVIDAALHTGELVDLGDIVLDPFVTFVGRVVEEDGSPVPDARVRATTLPAVVFASRVQDFRVGCVIGFAEDREKVVFEPPSWLAAYERKLPVPTTWTDGEGSFRLEGVPAGLVTTVVDKKDHVAAIKGPTPSGRDGVRDVGTITLSRGRTLRGRVVDAERRPIRGAQVVAGATSELGPVAVMHPSAPTDEEGRFEVRGVVEYRPILYAARMEERSAWEIVGPRDDDQDVEIVLPAPARLTVYLREAAGEVGGREAASDVARAVTELEVVASAELRIRSHTPLTSVPFPFLAPFHRPPGAVRRIADGQYEIEGLRAGEYELAGRAEGYAIASARVDLPPEGGEVVLLFAPASFYTVRVIDDGTEEPVARALISAMPKRAFGPALDQRATDVEGKVTLGPLAGNVEAGLTMRVEHPAYAVAYADLDPEDLEPTVRLVPGGTLEGSVHYAHSPPDGIYMFVAHHRPEDGTARMDRDLPLLAVTDLSGRFRLTNLAAGAYRYELFERFLNRDPSGLFQDGEAMDPDEVTQGRFEIELGVTTTLAIDVSPAALAAGATARGTIRVNGVAAEAYEVRIDPAVSRQDESPALPESERWRVTDRWGRFDFGEVPSGWTTLLVFRPGEGRGERRGSPVHQQWRELMPGEEWVVELDLAQIEVEVVVLSRRTGDPVTNARVRFSPVARTFSWSRGGGQTDAVGRVVIAVPQAGEFEVHVEHEKEGMATTRVEVPAEGLDQPIVLHVDAGVPCAGRVEIDPAFFLAPEGEPVVGGAYLLIRWSDPTAGFRSRGQQIQRDQREFTISGLMPGVYRAQLFAGRNWSEEIEFELPRAGATNLYFRFVPRGAGE